MVATLTITIPCKLGWTQLKGYDNSGNKDSTMKLSVEVTKSYEIKAVDFTKTVTERSREEATKEHAEVSAKATYTVVEASVSAGIEHSTAMKELLSSTKEVTRETNSKSSLTTKEEFTIGAGDQLYFYQRVFRGPGMSCALDVTRVSSDPSLEGQWSNTDMTVVTRPQRFIRHMDTAYGDSETDAPEERVRELTGQSADINKGMKGKYVWMVPEWTYESDEAATGFEILIQGSAKDGWKDLAKDAGGDYRYVFSNHNNSKAERVVDASLIRSDQWLTVGQQAERLSKGWIGGSRDINENRGGTYLFLAFKLF